MHRPSVRGVCGSIFVASLLFPGKLDAYSCREDLLPNGTINGCSNCHLNPRGGGTRNLFGRLIDTIALGCDEFWGPDIASVDSDKDGITNGAELGDPLGLWRVEDPDPGDPATVTNPGVAPTEVDCGDRIDNDADGSVDCDDDECDDDLACLGPEVDCNDGADNDRDDAIDCDDGDCADSCVPFVRSDANADGGIDVSDPIYVLVHLFGGGSAPPCAAAADANRDAQIDLSDAVWVLDYHFLGGPAPPPPYPSCAPQPGADCAEYRPCA